MASPDAQNRNHELIRRFYEELWNRFDKTKIEELLTEDFRFRGSLGHEKVGHGGGTHRNCAGRQESRVGGTVVEPGQALVIAW